MSERAITLHLEDILGAIQKIEDFTRGMTPEAFKQDVKTIDAVVRNIEIIGEATRNIPETLRLRNPTVPWKQIVGARDKVIHEYFGVDLDIIWKTVVEDVPRYKQQIEALLLAARAGGVVG